jgi:di/tricarboxylate transporter
MKKILEIFKGDKGEFSSKRFVGIIGAFVLFGTLAYNSTTHQDIAPSKELVEAVEWVTILTLGFTTIDKFGNNGKQV